MGEVGTGGAGAGPGRTGPGPRDRECSLNVECSFVAGVGFLQGAQGLGALFPDGGAQRHSVGGALLENVPPDQGRHRYARRWGGLLGGFDRN